MKALLIAALSASLLLSGCASTPSVAPAIGKPLPSQAMVWCEPLPDLPESDLSPDAEAEWIGIVAPAYAKCANKVKELARYILGDRPPQK